MAGPSTILDGRGRPFERRNGHASGAERARLKSLVTSLGQWQAATSSVYLPAERKAERPLNHHPWVFAAAMTIAITSTQAPLTVFRETEEALEERRRAAARARSPWRGPRAGARRRALQRYGRSRGVLRRKGLEPVLDHPVYDLLQSPNPLQRGVQLMTTTVLWMAYRGEAFWAFTDEDGAPVRSPLDAPSMVWPLSPDLFSPLYERGERGTLVGWELRTPRFMPSAAASRPIIRFPLHSIVQMKLPNPDDLVRGFARLTPVLSSITTDLMNKDFMRYLLENRAVIGGILEYDGTLDDEEEESVREKFRKRHSGPRNSGELMILQGGLKYNPAAMTPSEMGTDSTYRFNREEILAATGATPTALGIQEVANYATAQVFDRSFWEKGVLPILREIEGGIDGSLLFTETDDTVAMFDTSDVEAFRAGLADKVAIARSMSSTELHVPPRHALDAVGLEVPEFEGDSTALVSAAAVPLRDVLAPPEDPAPEAPAEPAAPEAGAAVAKSPPCRMAGETEAECVARKVPEVLRENPNMSREQAAAIAHSLCGKRCEGRTAAKASRRARWSAFVRVERRLEGAMRRGYRSWAGSERKATQDRLEREARKAGAKSLWAKAVGDLDVGAVLGDPKDARDALKSKTRPVYASAVEATYDLTLDDVGGVPVFGIDDERIMAVLDARERRLLDTVPATVRKNLSRSLLEGVRAGETLAQLRIRVAEVFNVAASSAKSLQVARTEMASLMNGVRDAMFEAQGFSRQEWVTAGDENVRESHVDFGSAGPQDRGFDYLTLLPSRKPGSLRYPGDPSGPPDEVINCRCVMVPA